MIADQLAVDHVRVAVVFVHQAFTIVNVILVIGCPIAVHDVIIAFHMPSIASHLVALHGEVDAAAIRQPVVGYKDVLGSAV